MNPNLKPVAINEILEEQFYIPHYQRGYRWTKLQVEQLLNDIDSFNPREIEGKPDEKTFYCLQPVVVKKLDEKFKKEKGLEGVWYEVIDGQQRLTTIHLIIRYINDLWAGRSKEDNFKLNYETRKECVTLFENIRVNDDEITVNINKENIDFYHITSAYQTIRNWELNYKETHQEKLNDGEFKSKLFAYSKIIWYEVAQGEDSQALFERLNLGKIPLTNAELVKALFLSSSSFRSLAENERQIKQLEIARLWDEMEHRLNEQDMHFWSFVTNKDRALFDTKIELILDFISGKSPDEKDPLFTFLDFAKRQKAETLSDLWLEIEHFYYTLVEWSKNRNLYHKIGYLIAAKPIPRTERMSLAELVKKSMEIRKDKFEDLVNAQIKESVKFEISELRYKDHPNHIFNILLLLNVETNRKSEAIAEFYPFKQHKNNQWSLEHIHARNSESFNQMKKEPWLVWLSIHLDLLNDLQENKVDTFDPVKLQELILKVERYNNEQLTWERFSNLFNEINNFFTEDAESMDRESEGLSNLALLSLPDNAALNNSVFEVKRRELIRLDKEGRFIPICTRRAFMKYYNEEEFATQQLFWSTEDRKKYFEEIATTLKPYLPENQITEDDDE
jgi:uncharacterized protein with ParB-like and HNH nuclease domain